MEASNKEIMDALFQGKIKVHEAAKTLNVSEDDIHQMIDEYEYQPTSDEIVEANKIVLENLESFQYETSCKKNITNNITPSDSVAKSVLGLDASGSQTDDLIINQRTDAVGFQPYHW
jgi:hypothetical protein